jgi:hypothetical protein
MCLGCSRKPIVVSGVSGERFGLRISSLTLDEDGSVTESTLGLGDGTLKALLEARLVPDDTHTTTTTAHGRLDDDGEAVLLDERLAGFVVLDRAGRTGDDGHAGLHGEGTGLGLVSEGVDGLGTGTDEGDASGLDLACELGVLGEETVTAG